MLQGSSSVCDLNAAFSSFVKELFFHRRFATVGGLCERSDLKCSNPTLTLTVVIEQKGIGAVPRFGNLLTA